MKGVVEFGMTSVVLAAWVAIVLHLPATNSRSARPATLPPAASAPAAGQVRPSRTCYRWSLGGCGV